MRILRHAIIVHTRMFVMRMENSTRTPEVWLHIRAANSRILPRKTAHTNSTDTIPRRNGIILHTVLSDKMSGITTARSVSPVKIDLCRPTTLGVKEVSRFVWLSPAFVRKTPFWQFYHRHLVIATDD